MMLHSIWECYEIRRELYSHMHNPVLDQVVFSEVMICYLTIETWQTIPPPRQHRNLDFRCLATKRSEFCYAPLHQSQAAYQFPSHTTSSSQISRTAIQADENAH
jgi:hypothetical protein